MAAVLPFIQKSLLLGLVGIQSSLPLALVFSVRPVFAQAAHPAREAIAVVPEVAQAAEPTDVGGSAEVNSGTTPGEATPRSLAEPIAPAEKPTPQQPTPYQQRLDRIRQALDSRAPENQNPALKQEFETQGKPSFSPKQRPPFTNFGNPGARPELLPTLTPNPAQPIPVQQFPIQQAPAQQVPVQQGILGSKFGRYRLGPNDVIFVNVQRFPNLNFQGPITPEGTIVLPLVGTVLLRDLTIGEASERVRVAYDRYIVSPQVNLSLISQRPVRVTVVGRVANPGFYGLTSAEISEALRLAGGTLASGDLRRVQIRRNSRSGQVIEQELDLYASVAQGVPFPDLRLEDGDTITIPQLPPDISSYDRTLVSNSTFASRQPVQVTVIGQVARPGFYVAQTGRVGEALLLAGGSLNSANLRQVEVRRNFSDGSVSQEIVDLYAPLVEGRPLPNLRLEEGDVINIPKLSGEDLPGYDRTLISNSTFASRQPVQVTVIGQVARPGFYVVQTGRVGEALLVAGGSLNSANLKQIGIRRNFSDGSVAQETVDLYSPLTEGLALPNIRLEEGDVVTIPKLSEADLASYDRRLVATSNVSKPTIQVRLLSYAAGGATTLTLPSGSTFRDALNGVPLDAAKLNSIALIRYDTATGKAVTQEIRGKDALVGLPAADVPLQDNDVVVIGRNLVSKITYTLNIFTQPFRDVLGFLLFFDSLSNSASGLFQPDGRR